MSEMKTNEKKKWDKLNVVVINVKEYEEAILANANSVCGVGCGWKVTCNVRL